MQKFAEVLGRRQLVGGRVQVVWESLFAPRELAMLGLGWMEKVFNYVSSAGVGVFSARPSLCIARGR